MNAYLEITRPVNCLMMGLAIIVGAVITGGWLVFPNAALRLLAAFVTGVALTAASMAVNDYFDREIDAINQPHRPIPSGRVKPRQALAFAAILATIGFISAILLGPSTGVIAAIAWVVFTTYTAGGKKTGFPGNLFVSATVAIPFIYGAYTVATDLSPLVGSFSAMAFSSNTGREVTKGIVDMRGDRAKGVRTVAVSLGERAAAYVSATFYLGGVSLSLLPIWLGVSSQYYVPVVALADLGFIYSSISIARDHTVENAKKTKTQVLIWMLLGLISFVVGGTTK